MANTPEINVNYKVTYDGLDELRNVLEALDAAFKKGLIVTIDTKGENS